MIEKFIKDLKSHEDFGKQIVHHEIIPSKTPVYEGPSPPIHPKLQEALKTRGINQLYKHQTRAITKVRAGKNVLIATPTASGKTLAYNIPVLESILERPQSRAFYIFPIKALEQDQLKAVKEIIPAIDGQEITAEIYDGDTTPHNKKKIKNNPPNIIITNPDMFHSGFLPYHSNWAEFFKNLKFIVRIQP